MLKTIWRKIRSGERDEEMEQFERIMVYEINKMEDYIRGRVKSGAPPEALFYGMISSINQIIVDTEQYDLGASEDLKKLVKEVVGVDKNE